MYQNGGLESNCLNNVEANFDGAVDCIDSGIHEVQQADNKHAEDVKLKRVRNPQPKFNEDILRSHRGLTALSRVFTRVQMKGRGHEIENLSTIMRTYAYWCHRMSPKYRFNECIGKLEKLGTKKRTMMYMQKIRSGLIEDEEIVRLSNSNVEDNEDINDSNHVNADTSQEALFTCQTSDEVGEIKITDEIIEQIQTNRKRALQIRTSKLRESEDTGVK